MSLTAAQMAAMSRLLDEALPLGAAGREDWLAKLPAEHADLAPALREALLPKPHDERAKNDIETLPKLGSAPRATASALRPSDKVGPYELIRPLGTGGMAEVWLARRVDGALKREVALKLPTLWRMRADLAQRFARERDILARLEHTHIARLYDAGVSAEGMPYLALEYVQGKPLTTWCDEHRLGLRERLRLFLQVLDAVQYAHGFHVIHRDLKPSNILVTPAGQVRLLDFGIAKLLADDEAESGSTEITQRFGRALTPEFASPEQLRGDAVAATTDIYSLGVMLYELLSGSRPYKVKAGATAAQLEQAITTGNIARPSDRVVPDGGEARASTSARIVRRLRGDLDAIALKALARDPRERYASASTLADDLQRHLSGEPVEARPARLVYRTGKWMLRHRVGTAAAAAVIVIGAVAGVAVYQATVSPSASRQAPMAAATTAHERSIAVLPFVDMSEKKDQEYFSDGLSEELIDHLARAADLKVIARTSSFQFKGKNEDARVIAQKLGVAHLLEGSVRKSGDAMRITAQLIKASDGSHVWSQTYDRNVSEIFKVQNEIAGTVARALKVAMRARPSGSASKQPDTEAYALVLRGNYLFARGSKLETEQAFALYKEAIRLDPAFALPWARLGSVYFSQASSGWAPWAESIADARSALDNALRIDPNLVSAHVSLAYMRLYVDYDWAGAQAEIDRIREIEPNDSTVVLGLESELALTHGRLDEAISLARMQVDRNPLSVAALRLLGVCLWTDSRAEEALRINQQMLQISPDYASAHTWGAFALLSLGEVDRARAEAEKETDEAYRLWGLSIVNWAQGRRAESDAALQTLKARYADGWVTAIGAAHAYRGERDAAFEWLDRAYREHNDYLSHIKTSPLFQNLRDDPRFRAFLVKMKLAD